MTSDPYTVLGIPGFSSEQEIRTAWRDKLRATHPDAGGSHEDAIRVNQALVDALDLTRKRSEKDNAKTTDTRGLHRSVRDVSSFTIDVLPVDCWHAIELVAGQCGSILVDEPPYLIEFTMHDSGIDDSAYLWCRCEMVPEAGATTVHITIGMTQPKKSPPLEVIRDFLVASLNELDWDN